MLGPEGSEEKAVKVSKYDLTATIVDYTGAEMRDQFFEAENSTCLFSNNFCDPPQT